MENKKGQITIQFLVNMLIVLLIFGAFVPTYYNFTGNIIANATANGDYTTVAIVSLIVPILAVVILMSGVVYISGSGRQEYTG